MCSLGILYSLPTVLRATSHLMRFTISQGELFLTPLLIISRA